MSGPVLVVDGLSVAFDGKSVVEDVSFEVEQGETVAVVGRSGAGKSTVASAILGLLPASAHVTGRAIVAGRDVSRLDAAGWQQVHGKVVGAIPQDPYSWFNPVRRLGAQMNETVRAHASISPRVAKSRSGHLLERAGLELGDLQKYPHELSGGMRQRACIAAAIAHAPPLLLADEPTSALDAIVQQQIMELLRSLRDEGHSLLLVSHDLRMVSRIADRVLFLDRGRIVEQSLAKSKKGGAVSGPAATPVLDVANVCKRFGKVAAVEDVSLRVAAGETLAIVGGSGCGKTTLARMIAGLERADAGSVFVNGASVTEVPRSERTAVVQILFQDVSGSLDPRMNVFDAVAEPLRAHKSRDVAERVAEAVAAVGLEQQVMSGGSHLLSGGQRQRVGLARALVLAPALVVLDEFSSSLDVDTRDEMIDLLAQLQDERRVAFVVISHDFDAVRATAHRVAVMHEGEIVEVGTTTELLHHPQHPESKALIAAAQAL